MKNFDHLLRPALLLILVAGLVLAAWHVSWLHKQGAGSRYEIQASERGMLLVLDSQQRVVYVGSGLFNGDKGIVWHTVPLP